MATGAFAAGGDRTMSIGRVFGRAFATIGDNPLTTFGIAFLFGGLPGLVWNLVSEQLRAPLAEPSMATVTTGIVLGFAGGLVYVVFAMITQGALVRATTAYSAGRRARIGEAAAAGLAVALPLLGLAILVGIGVTIGFILFFVPGVMLYIMWSVAAPALAAERCGVFAALGRSRFLTKGARWKIFGLELVVLVFYLIAVSAFGLLALAVVGVAGLLAGARPGLPIWYTLTGAAMQTLIAAVWGAIQASLYVELRDWKDGPATDRLADIFA